MASNLSIALMIGASVGGAVAGIKRLQSTLSTLRDNTLTTTAKLKSLAGTTALGVTGAISGIKATSGMVMNIAEPAIKFESAMADVKKVVDFKSPEGFANLSKDILNLTRTLPMTAEELAAITASGGQLGVAEEDLKDFTTTIAKMSVAFDMSAEDSGDAMAKLANVYKIPIKDIGNLGDAINELSNSSPAKASDIVSTLGRIGGVAKQFGLTENAAAALSNSFISLGKAPEVAGTAINGMLTKLMTADKGGKKFQDALKSMGLNAKDLKKAIANSEIWLHKFKNGTTVQHNRTNGEITVKTSGTVNVSASKVNITAPCEITGDVKIKGSLTATGDITSQATVSGASVKQGSTELGTHKHNEQGDGKPTSSPI